MLQNHDTDILLQIIATNIKKIRKEKKMTQDELAYRANIDRTYIGYIENAKHNITIGKLAMIAKALNVELKYIMESEDSKIL